MPSRISSRQVQISTVKAAAWAGLTLIDPNRLTGWRKHAYWLAMATVTAAEVVTPGDPERHPLASSPELAWGAAIGTGGLVYGGHEMLAKSDAWSIRLLRKMGLRHPRRWAAAFVGISTLAVTLAEARRPALVDGAGDEADPELEPLPADVRAVIAALLDALNDFGAEQLRAQLDSARCWQEEGQVGLVVDEAAPRTHLRDYTFPVSALFERNGHTHVLLLEVEDGALSYLSHFVDSYELDESEVDWTLPDAASMTFIVGDEDFETQ